MSKPTHIVCKCGEENRLSLWVFAHWHEEISFTCQQCQNKVTLFRGEIVEGEGETR